MSYTAYTEINSLEEFSLIAGNSYTIDFIAYQSDGVNPMDLGGASVYWILSPYGQPDYNIVQITGTVTGLNTFEFNFTSTLSSPLSGKYVHQPVIVSFSGKEYRPAQGICLIIPRIPRT
jgi:hypothetical protein